MLSFLSPLVNLVYPHACLVCGREGALVCPRCLFALPHSEPACLRCGSPSPFGQTCAPCHQDVAIDGLLSLSPFDDPRVQRLVKALKYENMHSHIPLWLEARHDVLFQFEDERVVVPIPLHKKREQHRGYNQSLIIARALAGLTGWPVVPALLRTRATEDQTLLTKQERQKNMAGAFCVPPELAWTVNGQHMVLVDDVATTGATLNAAAQELVRAGAASVWAFTLARADQKENRRH